MNFDKHYNKYDENSIVQKKVAEKLYEMLKKYNLFSGREDIFEIGCGTGIFTNFYKNEIEDKKLFLNDIFDVRKFLSNIKYEKFLQGDIEKIDIPKSDIVLSSSVFQWIKNLDALFKKICENTNKLAFSIYVEGNLIEIKNHFDVSLNYYTSKEIEKILKKYFSEVSFVEEKISLEFENSLELLKHLKFTGVTGIKKVSIASIRSFKEKNLTYKVAYFICKK